MNTFNFGSNTLIILTLLAFLGNVAYAIGAPGGWIKYYSPGIVALSLIAFVWIHGVSSFGRQTLGWFVLIVFSVAWVAETVSMITGTPFGNYHYTEIMSPFLWHVPVFVLPAYALMGYISWSMASLILGEHSSRISFSGTFLVPVLAAFHMVVWDLSMDPLRATLEQRWIWLDGGMYFGVPITNFLGWFVVTWCMFQLFAWYLRHRNPKPSQVNIGKFMTSVPLAYLAFSGEYLLNPFVSYGDTALVLVNGSYMPVQHLYSDIALICATTMVPLAAFAMARATFQNRNHSQTVPVIDQHFKMSREVKNVS